MRADVETITIGELSNAAGVNVQTVRYYERRGLLPQPARRASGYREYPRSDIARLGFIRRAQGLGFTLAEIEELLSLKVDPKTTPEQVHGRVKEKISNVATRIAELEEIQDALSRMEAACTRHGLAGDCPFLDALSEQNT